MHDYCYYSCTCTQEMYELTGWELYSIRLEIPDPEQEGSTRMYLTSRKHKVLVCQCECYRHLYIQLKQLHMYTVQQEILVRIKLVAGTKQTLQTHIILYIWWSHMELQMKYNSGCRLGYWYCCFIIVERHHKPLVNEFRNTLRYWSIRFEQDECWPWHQLDQAL